MNKEERKNVVLAMEYFAKSVNNEDVMDSWLMCGVADGDIPFGSTDTSDVDEYYIEDENFKELMKLFLKVMSNAYRDGGLYIDRVCSGDKNES